MANPFHYQFTWDPTKARQNLKKHGVSFERAATVFLDPRALSEFDANHSEREERWVSIGLDLTGALLVVCHTYQGSTDESAMIRLISARKATAREATQYREA
ncbi:MAG: BrnT family toxin [Terriglobia bacterium]